EPPGEPRSVACEGGPEVLERGDLLVRSRIPVVEADVAARVPPGREVVRRLKGGGAEEALRDLPVLGAGVEGGRRSRGPGSLRPRHAQHECADYQRRPGCRPVPASSTPRHPRHARNIQRPTTPAVSTSGLESWRSTKELAT